MWPRFDGRRACGFATPGEMRDRLNALVLAGEKTATAGLWKDEYGPEDEPIDVVGEEQILLDSSGEPLAVVEVTRVEALRFDSVPWEFAEAEGEGFRSIEHWRSGHRSYFDGQGVTVNDDDLVVCTWFAVREVLGPRWPRSAALGTSDMSGRGFAETVTTLVPARLPPADSCQSVVSGSQDTRLNRTSTPTPRRPTTRATC